MYVQTEHCIPPGNQHNPATGSLILTLSNIVIVKPFAKELLSFRLCLWGSKCPQLFVTTAGGRVSATFTVRSSQNLLMKYLSDMETLLIEAFDKRNTKRIGTMVVNLKRFQTLNAYGQPVISEFNEKFQIYGSSRQKIGEATLGLEQTQAIPTQPIIQTAHFIQQIVFREDPDRPILPKPSDPKQINQNTQTNHQQSRPIPNKPTVVINGNNYPQVRETFKRNRQQQTDYIQPYPSPPRSPSKEILNYSVNLQLQKLKDDQALLLGNSTQPSQNLTDNEINIEIVGVRFFSKPSRPLDKLTVVYPQISKYQPTQITSILVPVATSSNYYSFQQFITVKIGQRVDDQEVTFYCGQSVGSFQLLKFINSCGVELKLIMKKKDGTRFCQIICKPHVKIHKVDYSLLLYIGEYRFAVPGQFYLVIKSKIHESKTITPINPKNFHVKLIFPLVNLPEIFVIEARRRGSEGEIIQGIIKLKVDVGGSDEKIQVKSVQGLTVGWLRLITRVDTSSQISLFSSKLEQQIRNIRFPVEQQKLPNPPPIIVPQPNVIPPAPTPQPKPEPQRPEPQKPQTKQTFFQTFPQMYLKVLESIRLCKNPRCKTLTDKFVSKRDISEDDFFGLLKLSCPSLSDQQLKFFCRHFDYPLKFQVFANSYRKYIQYQRQMRNRMNQNIQLLKKSANYQDIQSAFKSIPLCFGYIDYDLFINKLEKLSGNKDLAINIAKYLYQDKRRQIHLDSFYKFLLQQNQSLRDSSPYIFSQVILKQFFGQYSLDQIQTELKRFIEDNNYLNILTHFQSVMLEAVDQLALLSQYIIDATKSPEVEPQEPKRDPEPAPIPTPKPPVEQPPKPQPKIQMVIGWIDTHIQDLTDILINKQIYLQEKELPKRILLTQGQTCQITIHNKEGFALQGHFVAQRNISKIRLYCKSKQVGWLNFGQPDEEVKIQVIKKRTKHDQKQTEDDLNKFEYSNDLKYLASEKVKLEILSVVPSGSYQINIDGLGMKYPVESQATITNSKQKPLPVKVFGKYGKSEITISLIDGITKYAVNNPDGSLLCILQLSITEYYGEPRTMPIGKKSLFMYFSRIDHILRDQNRQRKYNLTIQTQDSSSNLEFSFYSNAKSAMIDTTIQVPATKEYLIKIMSGSSKAAEFNCAVRFNIDLGIYRHEGYLRSGPWRLSLVCFEINYNDDFSLAKKGQQKMARLFKVFNHDSLDTICTQFKRSTKDFSTILQQRFKFTVSETNVLEGLLGSTNPRFIFNPLPTQKIELYNSLLAVKQVHDELQLYDFQGQGFVKQQKAALVCSLIFKESQINADLTTFVPRFQQTYIADLRTGNCQLVDYFEILRHIQMWRPQDKFFWGNDPNISNDKKQDQQQTFDDERKKSKLVGKTVKVNFLGYEDIVYRSMPGTFCFMVGDRRFTQPILRAYSHKYVEPFPSLVVKLPCRLKVYNKEYGMVQLWKLVEICDTQLEEVSKVLNGKAYFRFEDTELKPPVEPDKKQQVDPNKKKDIPTKPIPQPRNQISPSKVPFFPPVTPIKPDIQNMRVKKQIEDQAQKREQINRFRKVMNQQIDLSKYNFDDSDDD